MKSVLSVSFLAALALLGCGAPAANAPGSAPAASASAKAQTSATAKPSAMPKLVLGHSQITGNALAAWSAEDGEYFKKNGVDVDAHSGDGQTALFYAVLGNHIAVVRLLLERGAHPGMRTQHGDIVETAIWKAAHGGGGQPDLSIEVLEALIAAGGKAPDRHPPVNEQVDAFLTRHGSVADPKRYWSGEEPRSA